MTELYTSYATSVALRAAGAPQGGRHVRRASGDVIEAWQSLLAEQAPEHLVACFRADEIIEALGREICAINRVERDDGSLWWSVETESCGAYGEPTLVDALAAAWLAVLGEKK